MQDEQGTTEVSYFHARKILTPKDTPFRETEIKIAKPKPFGNTAVSNTSRVEARVTHVRII
jgi:hypothetical protein